MTPEWRKPYTSLDAGGSPDSACWVGEQWIEERAAEAVKLYGVGRITLHRDGGSTILYLGTDPIAVATVFRTPMNRATLIRWTA
jgi:hypothetical protein